MKTTLLLLAASILLTSPAHAQATVTPQAGQLRKAGDMQVTLTALASSAETIEASFLVQNMGAVGVTLKPLAQISAKNSAGSALDAKTFSPPATGTARSSSRRRARRPAACSSRSPAAGPS